MASYDLLKDFDIEDEEIISVSPYTVVAVWPYARHITFDRNKIASPGIPPNISVTTDISDIVRIAGDKPIIMRDCTMAQITGSKSNHCSQMAANFQNSGSNYLQQIFQDDWVGAWIVYGEEKYHDLIRRLNAGEACNEFNDGLKFLGKVRSFRKQNMLMEDGKKKSVYAMQALGFREFANALFYDERLQMRIPFFADIVGKLNIAIDELMSFDRNTGIDTNKFVPLALDLILGRGAPQSFANPGGDLPIAAGPVQDKGSEPTAACVVPSQVAHVLGIKEAGSKAGLFSYADLMNVVIGIQKYQGADNDWRAFVPRGAEGGGNRKVFANTDVDLQLIGSFLPMPMPFTNKALWSLLNEFLNPVVNEMYTALRVNGAGKIVPTLTVRQIPFTSNTFASHKLTRTSNLGADSAMTATFKVSTTRFLELPRWKAAPNLVRNYDIGRSGQAHFNFFHVYGAPVFSQPLTSLTSQIVRNPPLSDDLDIRREGIQPFTTTVNCSPNDASGDGAKIWMQLAADFHAGQQYCYNGTVNLIGITEPIVHGDNFEWDGVVYHIETVSHSFTISEDGKKRFSTYLALSRGVRSDTDAQASLDGWVSTDSLDAMMYPGMSPNDNTLFDPGHGGDME